MEGLSPTDTNYEPDVVMIVVCTFKEVEDLFEAVKGQLFTEV